MNASTPDALLEAAEALFSAHGYDAVGIREIADRAGANIASIRYHFGGKRELYVATVHRSMKRRHQEDAWLHLEEAPSSRRDAAVRLAGFIRAKVDAIVGDPCSAACAQLLHREASTPSEAFGAVVDGFVRPHIERLERTIAVIDPDLTKAELTRRANFVLGLVVHHHHFRPFIEELGGSSFESARVRNTLTEDLIRFALRGLRAGETFIDRVIETAKTSPPKPSTPSAPTPKQAPKKTRASAPTGRSGKGSPA